MTYPRVNLLKKSEQRYQGIVSRRFIMTSIVAAPVLLILIIGATLLVQYGKVKSELKEKRDIWKDREPKLAQFNKEERDLNNNRRTLAFFETWQKSPAPLAQLLEAIQDTVPMNIQFIRLSLRSEVSTALYAQPEDMALDYKLSIEGIAQGDGAEVEVIQFRKDLLESADIVSAFKSIELSGPMRKRQNASGVSIREFRLVGVDAKGGGK